MSAEIHSQTDVFEEAILGCFRFSTRLAPKLFRPPLNYVSEAHLAVALHTVSDLETFPQ